MRSKQVLFGAVLACGLGGCEVLSKLATESNLFSIGAIPLDGFSDVNSADYGGVTIYLGQEDISFLTNTFLELESDQSEVLLDDVTHVEGNDQGDLLLLADGSGSLEQFGCLACPTDPMRYRVEAVKILTSSLHECAPDWRVGLQEFGDGDTHTLSDYTHETAAILKAADQLVSEGGTPLWDSLIESLNSMSGKLNNDYSLYSDGEFGKGIVVISDGEDTESWSSVRDVIQLAKQHNIPVSAIGLASSSDLVDGFSGYAIEDLRSLAKETGGFYAAVSSPVELPLIADHIAQAYCTGYSEVNARFVQPPAAGDLVKGKIKLKGTDLGAPFSFRAP